MAHISKEKREDTKRIGYKSVYEKQDAQIDDAACAWEEPYRDDEGVAPTDEGYIPPTRAELDEDANGWKPKKRKDAKKGKNKVGSGLDKVMALLVVALILAVGAAVIFMSGSLSSILEGGIKAATSANDVSVEGTGAAMTDEERQLLANAGYDPDKFQGQLQGFLNVYLTYSPGSLSSGQWKDNVGEYVDESKIETYAENDLKSKWASDDWADDMAEHPSAISNLESIDDVEWYLTTDSDGSQVPFCFVRVTLTRPAIDSYTLNSPACEVCRFQDDYNVYFDSDGDVTRVRRVGHAVLDTNLEPDLTAQDESKMKKERDSKKAATDAAAETKAKEEAEKAAREEIEKAAEEAKKAAEEAEAESKANEDTSPSNSSSSNNSGGNVNNSSSTNTDNGNSSGNTSGGDSGGNSGGDSGGTTPEPAEPAQPSDGGNSNSGGNANSGE